MIKRVTMNSLAAKQRFLSGKAWIDVLSIIVLLILNPVVYHLNFSRGYFPPDAVSYLDFAENFLSQGMLYFESGMEGAGKILPPFYPFLMLVGDSFVGDYLITSELVSSFATIATSLVFYFVIRKFGNSYFALLGAVGIQLNYQLNLWALTPLTEASFILVVACAFWLTITVLQSERVRTSVALGVILALAFLTRQVGILLIPFFLLVIILNVPRKRIAKLLGLIAGLALLLVPYQVILHQQGNQIDVELSALDTSWSKRKKISIDDVDEDTQRILRSLHDLEHEDYIGVYVKRRLLRQLLPDGSAMYLEVEMNPGAVTEKIIVRRVAAVWSSLDQFGSRFFKNAQYVYESLGAFVCLVFLTTLVTPVWARTCNRLLVPRYLIGGFALYYLAVLSMLTGLVDRYALILVPFVLLHIFIELVLLLRMRFVNEGSSRIGPVMFLLIVAACVLLQPSNYSDIAKRTRGTLEQVDESRFRQFINQGEPVFSIAPFHAYVAGGTWRMMPNDSLEKIAKYAKYENVRWLLVVHKPQKEVAAYKLAQSWYLDKNLLRQYRHLVDLRAVSRDGRSFLFEFITD